MRSLILVLALLGCGPPEPTVDIGTGESSFEPLTDGQDVTLVRGSQGGHHMWMSLRVDGLDPQKVWLDADVELEGERFRSRNITALTSEGDQDYLVGWPLVMTDPARVDGKVVKILVTLTDQDGNVADATINVRPHLP